MAIDWETATAEEKLEETALWVYRMLIIVRVGITPIDSSGPYGSAGIAFKNYCCIPATKDNDEAIREIADEWKASGLFGTLPLFMKNAEEADDDG